MFGRFSRILLVDDSTVQRKIVRGLLGALGFENVDEAADGKAALTLLGTHSYRLVLADWDMAPLNGSELLRTMRRNERFMRVPFIMLTAHAQKKFVDIARDDGITYYLAKPFTADMLAERIARIGRRAVA